MQFKNPEVFYFLVLLLIPIVVHLFQLQKFRKIAFTNVAFLKKISLETRKSSKLKKWLILATRLIGLLALLFVFSQPYLRDSNSNKNSHNFIYLDNSLSLNTNGNKGNQLKITTQELIENSSKADLFTLFTNDEVYDNLDQLELSKVLKNINFSSKSTNLKQVLLQIESKKINATNTLNKTILVSDYQAIKNNNLEVFTNVNTPILGVKLDNEASNNISIDSLFIQNSTSEEITLSTTIRNQGNSKSDIPIALYNNDELISKRSFSIDANTKKEILFSIPNTTKLNGKIVVTSNDIFIFDNTFYFHLNSDIKTDILNIGNNSKALEKIFSSDAFIYEHSIVQNVDYNRISDKECIILNELENIPNVLQNTLIQFLQNGGHLLLIPNREMDFVSYNNFLTKIGSGKVTGARNTELKITDINFDHPLYSNVFSKRVTNFQYPKVEKYFRSNLKGTNIIKFENKEPFLLEVQNPYSKVYWFSSPINSETSNFANSPLIVPTLFNIGQNSLQISRSNYILQEENTIEIEKKINKDEVLSISKNSESYIPLQQSFANKVRITTSNKPNEPGFSQVLFKTDTILTLAFNISKEESNLDFIDTNDLEKANSNIKMYNSVKDLFGEINEKNEVQWLWKLFLVIAIVSLLLEIFILKFFKT